VSARRKSAFTLYFLLCQGSFHLLPSAKRDLARSILYCGSASATDEKALHLCHLPARVFVSGHRAAIVLGCVLWSK
jgi:hypothetical protein